MADTLSIPGDFITYSVGPLTGLTGFSSYTTNITGTVYKVEFRWSFDGINFSVWSDLNATNIQCVDILETQQIWLEIRVTLLSGGPVVVNSVEIKPNYVVKDPLKGFVPFISRCESGNLTGVVKLPEFSFKPYAVNPALILQQELSMMINGLFGHDVLYWRATPQKRSADITFMEWTLLNVSATPICFKVVVPNNEFPDAQIQFGPFGVDFETPFEVHIDRGYFEQTFGNGKGPQKGDIVYFTNIHNHRIYQIASSYLFRGFMEKGTYFKVSLVKYEPSSHRLEPDSVRDTFDAITVDTTELFDTALREDEEKLTKPMQYSRDIGDSVLDPIRSYINLALGFDCEEIKNYTNLISHTQYNLTSILGPNIPATAITYKTKVDICTNTNLSFSAWIKLNDLKKPNYSDNIISSVLLSNVFTIVLDSKRNYVLGDVIKVFKNNGLVLFGTVTTVTSQTTYKITIDQEVLDKINLDNPFWTGLSGYKAQLENPAIIFDGYDQTLSMGWKAEIYAKQFLKVTLGPNYYYFILPEPLKIDWYGIFISWGPQFCQLSTFIWERQWSDKIPTSPKTTNLLNIYSKAINNIEAEDWSHDKFYTLKGSPLKITNIRLFDIIPDLSVQSNILNQNIVIDSDHLILADNAISRQELPYIGNSK